MTWGLLTLALAHSAAVMLWIMPINPIRAAVGNERIANYVRPLFDQNWSVFAPSPGVSYCSLVVRAYVGDPDGGGELRSGSTSVGKRKPVCSTTSRPRGCRQWDDGWRKI